MSLATLALALLLLTLFDPWLERASPALGPIVNPSDLAVVNYVSLQHADLPRVKMKRDLAGPDSRWKLEGRLASETAAANILGVIRLLRPTRIVSPAPNRGLESPSGHIEIRGNGKHTSMYLGVVIGESRWVRVTRPDSSSTPRDMLIERHLINEIFLYANDLEARMLLDWNPTSTEPLHLQGEFGLLAIEGAMLIWGVDERASADAGRVRSFRDQLRALRFDKLELERLQYSCVSSRRIEIVQGENTTTIKECQDSPNCQDSQVMVAQGGRVGCIERHAWNALLTLVENPLPLVSLRLLPTMPQDFSIQCNEKRAEVKLGHVDPERLESWWHRLNEAVTSVQLVSDAPDALRLHCQLGFPEHQVEFLRSSLEDVRPTRWYARIVSSDGTNATLLYTIDTDLRELLRADLNLFESLQLIDEEPLFALQIRLGSITLRRSEMMDTYRSDTPDKLDDGEATMLAITLRAGLAQLRATSYEDIRMPASHTLSIEFESQLSDETHHYTIDYAFLEEPSEAQTCLLRVNKGRVARLANCRFLRSLEKGGVKR